MIISFDIIIYIIYIIVLIIIFQEIFKLTNLCFKYIRIYDYGNSLNKNCGNEKIEYETSRYQFGLNYKNLLLNDNNFILILIISIIFTSIISIIFNIIIYKTLCNIDYTKNLSIINKMYILFIILICFVIILYPIIVIIYLLLDLSKRKNYSIFNSKNKIWIASLVIISILILLKIYLNIYDLSIFNKSTNKKSELILFILYSFIYIISIYFLTNILILYKNTYDESSENNNILEYYIKKIIGLNDHYKNIDKIQSIKNTPNLNYKAVTYDATIPININNIHEIKVKIKSLITSNGKLPTVYDDKNELIYYIITNYINYAYDNGKLLITNRNSEDLRLYKKKLSQEIIQKYKQQTLPNLEQQAYGLCVIIISEIELYISNIKKNNNQKIVDDSSDNKIYKTEEVTKDIKSIFKKNIAGLIFILIILILLFVSIYLILKYINKYEYLKNNIYNFIIIPFIILFILLFVINSTSEYNNLINDYIIKLPNEKYIESLKTNNELFDNFIKKDNATPKYVFRSIIYLLLSEIFNLNYPTYINNLDYIDNNQHIDNNNYIKLDSYIKVENFDHNLFYGRGEEGEECYNNCNCVNYSNVENIIKNLKLDLSVFNSEIIDKFKDKLNKLNIQNNIDISEYILDNIINKDYTYHIIKSFLITKKDDFIKYLKNCIFHKIKGIKYEKIEEEQLSDESYIEYTELIDNEKILSNILIDKEVGGDYITIDTDTDIIKILKANLDIRNNKYIKIQNIDTDTITIYKITEKKHYDNSDTDTIAIQLLSNYDGLDIQREIDDEIIQYIGDEYIKLLIYNYYLVNKYELSNFIYTDGSTVDRDKKNNIVLYINHIVEKIDEIFIKLEEKSEIIKKNNDITKFLINNFNSINDNNKNINISLIDTNYITLNSDTSSSECDNTNNNDNYKNNIKEVNYSIIILIISYLIALILIKYIR